MRRQITRADQTELIKEARRKVPGIAIRTTMLVGFPGETEEEFEELCDFVREMKFERLGVFMYSHEEDTIAYLKQCYVGFVLGYFFGILFGALQGPLVSSSPSPVLK